MIHIDFETRSVVNLPRTGIYPYAAHPSTDINCLGWAIGDAKPQLWNRGERFPAELRDALLDTDMLLAAWNAQFERLIWNQVFTRHGAPRMPLERFYCVAALSRARGFPGALEKAARFAGLNIQKDMDGHYIMMKLCRPRRIEEDGTIVWWDSPDEYARQGIYCLQDVEVERAMFHSFIPFTEQELADYHMSERINDRGICVDVELAQAAVTGVELEKIDADVALKSLTGGRVQAASQVQRIKAWVEDEWKPLPDMNKSTLQEALLEDDIPPEVADVLEIRLEQGRAAVSKYVSILEREMDGVVRGLFMFRGAGQTGRFSSVGLQVHNMLSESCLAAIPILKKRGIAGLRMLGDPVKLLGQMVRPTFIARRKKKFVVVDFSQIEARIAAWLAGEEKLLSVFRANGDAYCDFGTRASGRKITKADVKLRKVYKACVLGLGFGGSDGALARSMKKEKIELPASELKFLVGAYREEYSNIPQLWYALRDAVLLAMYSKGTIVPVGPVSYLYDGIHLWCRLPSGRLMCYPFAKVVQDDYGDCVEYRRGNRSPKSGVMEWPTVRLWYGMLIENLAQAIAFDLLTLGLRKMEETGRIVRLHVHDEFVVEVDEDKADEELAEIIRLVTLVPDWAEGLPLAAEGHVTDRYTK